MASLFEKCRVFVCLKRYVDRLEATENTSPVVLSGREATVKIAKREKKSSEPIHLRTIGMSSDTRERLIQLKYQCWSPMDHHSSSFAPLQHHYDVLTQNKVYSICPACPFRLWISYERVPAVLRLAGDISASADCECILITGDR